MYVHMTHVYVYVMYAYMCVYDVCVYIMCVYTVMTHGKKVHYMFTTSLFIYPKTIKLKTNSLFETYKLSI